MHALTDTKQAVLQSQHHIAVTLHPQNMLVCCMQALTLWLQYITLLGAVNISAPAPVHWVLSAASFAFASVTSGALSTDCLQSGSTNTAVQRVLLHLAVPILVLLLLTVIQTFWYVHVVMLWQLQAGYSGVSHTTSEYVIDCSSVWSHCIILVGLLPAAQQVPAQRASRFLCGRLSSNPFQMQHQVAGC